ncbi:sulfate adenylyltransferase [Candidatus Methylomirabilis sp.]|uniref:sulfate adenylyltransferase n=1 Tax=Candidatus Methylomirabilis sp. TaxID=2032687 RepID=UPI0030766E73
MLPKPHGGKLIDRLLKGEEQQWAVREAVQLPRLELTAELAKEAMNIASGVFSPLEGFMRKADCDAVQIGGRLANGVPWTIPIVLDVSEEEAEKLGDRVALSYHGEPFAVLEVQEIYTYDREALASAVFGTTNPRHPGVGRVRSLKEILIGGRIGIFRELESPWNGHRLHPVESRVLFQAKGWKTVVGFQTRNVPHLGHEYVQKTALSFVDGIFINPVIGKKKVGDFTDEVILRTYEALITHYYPRERAVLAVLETEMRYAGPREAIFHAIVRKNFGCSHFIVGRDHAGVADFYPPYAAQEIFDEFPDLGIVPLFFTAFFHCGRCGGAANEKTCPHNGERQDFSGTQLRNSILQSNGEVGLTLRPEVAQVIQNSNNCFVE